MTLIAPGVWIAPIGTHWSNYAGVFRVRSFEVREQPYLCTAVYPSPSPDAYCPECKSGDGMWLEVEDFPHFAFCAAHWRPLYRPKQTWAEQFETWEPVKDASVA